MDDLTPTQRRLITELHPFYEAEWLPDRTHGPWLLSFRNPPIAETRVTMTFEDPRSCRRPRLHIYVDQTCNEPIAEKQQRRELWTRYAFAYIIALRMTEGDGRAYELYNHLERIGICGIAEFPRPPLKRDNAEERG